MNEPPVKYIFFLFLFAFQISAIMLFYQAKAMAALASLLTPLSSHHIMATLSTNSSRGSRREKNKQHKNRGEQATL